MFGIAFNKNIVTILEYVILHNQIFLIFLLNSTLNCIYPIKISSDLDDWFKRYYCLKENHNF